MSIRSNPIYDTPIAPLGLAGISLPIALYTYRPSGAFYIGQDVRPTGIGVNFIAQYVTSNLRYYNTEDDWESVVGYY